MYHPLAVTKEVTQMVSLLGERDLDEPPLFKQFTTVVLSIWSKMDDPRGRDAFFRAIQIIMNSKTLMDVSS